jgi:hypothetical protein
MHEHEHSQQIEQMLDVMLCLPKSAWASVLLGVKKKIGAAALQKIILQACHEAGFERQKSSTNAPLKAHGRHTDIFPRA